MHTDSSGHHLLALGRTLFLDGLFPDKSDPSLLAVFLPRRPGYPGLGHGRPAISAKLTLETQVVCSIFSKKQNHGMCGLYYQTTTPGGNCHGQEEVYRICI
jgi:hypothetical protein